MDARVWFASLVAHLLPASCMGCGAAAAARRLLCAGCSGDLPRNTSCCARCAMPLPHAAQRCGACLRRPPAYAGSATACLYAEPVDRWIAAFKFRQRLDAGRLLGELLVERSRAVAWCADIDAIVPVPLHVGRLRERGYNQALELARPLQHALQMPLRPHWLQRIRATPAQRGLDAPTRRRNLRRAFVADAAVRGLRILLVDDVITTGSTVDAAARALRRAGAREVRVIAVARVG